MIYVVLKPKGVRVHHSHVGNVVSNFYVREGGKKMICLNMTTHNLIFFPFLSFIVALGCAYIKKKFNK